MFVSVMLVLAGCARSSAQQQTELRVVATGTTAPAPTRAAVVAPAPEARGTDADAWPTAPHELKLVRAVPIDRWDNFQPSGLLWQADKLLTVSDKHDRHVFELLIEQKVAKVRVHRTLQLPAGVEELDLEALCDDGHGGLLLASEKHLRVLRVDTRGGATWFTLPLREAGARAGLFQLDNAALEGLARMSDGNLVVAAERSERGLIEIPVDGGVARARAWSLPTTPFELSGDRKPDFSDLATSGDALFALIRNGHLIVRLERTPTGWREDRAWSYAKTENDPRYTYNDRKYGIGEGLALDENFVYVAMDNNRDRRTVDPNDIRPLLLVFERPIP